MNTKNNRRRRQSVERMERVFVELLQSRELGEITVSDICKRAELNRSTFYANFDDIYALAGRVRERLEEEVSALYGREAAEHFNSNDYLRLFRHIRDNQLFYKTYFKLGYDRGPNLFAYDRNQAERYFQNRHIEYHMTFFKSGFNAIVKLWLERGCRETPEEMEAILRSEYQGRDLLFSGGQPDEKGGRGL